MLLRMPRLPATRTCQAPLMSTSAESLDYSPNSVMSKLERYWFQENLFRAMVSTDEATTVMKSLSNPTVRRAVRRDYTFLPCCNAMLGACSDARVSSMAVAHRRVIRTVPTRSFAEIHRETSVRLNDHGSSPATAPLEAMMSACASRKTGASSSTGARSEACPCIIARTEGIAVGACGPSALLKCITSISNTAQRLA